MRLSRAVSLLMALLLAATLSQTLVSPSQAMRPTPVAHAAKGLTPLVANMVEAGNNHFVVYGVAGVTKVGIFRNANGGRFFLYRKITVNKSNGKFRTRVYQYKRTRTCYRVLAPATSNTSQHIVPVGCIVSVRGKQVWQPS
ncbi:MAG: hypothetical protein QOD98_1347 [Nocardioidaceae bacterium]|nr:hypothetical protein [Nocardioidaceae bacterium]